MRPFSSHITRRLEVSWSPKANFHMSRSRRWRTKNIANREAARASLAALKMEKSIDYSAWSNEKLIERVTQLEAELKNQTQRSHPPSFFPYLY